MRLLVEKKGSLKKSVRGMSIEGIFVASISSRRSPPLRQTSPSGYLFLTDAASLPVLK